MSKQKAPTDWLGMIMLGAIVVAFVGFLLLVHAGTA